QSARNTGTGVRKPCAPQDQNRQCSNTNGVRTERVKWIERFATREIEATVWILKRENIVYRMSLTRNRNRSSIDQSQESHIRVDTASNGRGSIEVSLESTVGLL